MKAFVPDMAYIDPKALKYKKSIDVLEKLKSLNIPIVESRSVKIEEDTIQKNFTKSKKTIYVTVNNQKKLQQCRPSADYMIHLSSSCPAHCEYCYLQTTQGDKPFLKLFVNLEDIFNVVEDHIKDKKPNITTFECGSITDPLALEHLTGNLRDCIDYFGKNEYGRLRVISKYDTVDTLLNVRHNNHTKFRFSINARYVISSFEHGTASFDDRIVAASKIAEAGYPLGFIIAPIMVFEDWKEQYDFLLSQLSFKLRNYKQEISFELIQHRFTNTAKELILQRYPNTKLDMDEEKRELKWGPYGKFKHVYPKDISSEMKSYLVESIHKYFKNAVIEYFT